jgi:hypothetical protein
MAEPVSNINDAGSPVASGADRLNVAGVAPLPPALPGMATDEEENSYAADRSNPRLNSAAEKVGGAVGSAVESIRRARLKVVGGRNSDAASQLRDTAQRTRERVSDLTGEAGDTISEWTDTAADRMDQFREVAGERLRNFSGTMSNRLYYARRRAQYLAREYPLHTILAFGGLAFIVGFTLRIWRSNGD